MNRRLAMVALTLGLTATVALAQDDPLKGKPNNQGLKQLDKKGGDAKAPEKEAKEDPKKIMERIARNMVKVEGNLKNSDVSDVTRKIQRDIISDLDKLLEQEQNKNQGGGGGAQNQEPQNQDQKQQQQPQNGQSEPKQGEGQPQGQPQGQAKDGGKQQQPDNMGQQPQPGKAKPEGAKKDSGNGDPQVKEGTDKKAGPQDKGDQFGKAKPDKGEKNNSDKLGEPKDSKVVQEPKTMKDVKFNPWGHLPERERPQMNIYAQDRFIPQFEDQLQRYYRALAAKNRQGKN